LQTSQALELLTSPFKDYIDDVKQQVDLKRQLYDKYSQMYATELKHDTFNNPHNLTYDDLALPTIDIVNIVISSKMDLDTEKIKADGNTEWYPKRFPGFIHRVYVPCKSTLLVFRTGNVICTGTRFVNDASRILSSFHNKFKSNPNDTSVPELAVKNLVVQIYFKYMIDVDETINTLPRAIYEPEQFPGIIYRNVEPKAVVLLFVSGKSICVGCDNIENAFHTIFKLRKMLLDKGLLVLRK
jgi:transcription initiation factor TFIID TATA-box-binding protein